MSDDVNADLSAAFDAQATPEAKPEEKPVDPVEKPEEAASEEGATDTPVEEKPEEKKPVRAPEGLKPEFKVRFAELDPEWQEEILRREQDAARGINELSEKAKVAKELDRAIAPYEPMIQMMGAPKAEIIQNMLQTAYVLNQGSPDQKAAVLRGIMTQYGIELPAGDVPEVDPKVAALERELAALRGEVQGQARQEIGITRQQAMSDIDAFAAADGHEFFPEVKVLMGKLIGDGTAKDLEDAYQKACRLNDDVFKAVQLKEQRQGLAAQARAAKDAKAAAKQVSGSGPSDEVKKVHDDPRDDVRALVEKGWG